MRCLGFSLLWAFSSCGEQALGAPTSSCNTWAEWLWPGQLPRSMPDLPRLGLNPCLQHCRRILIHYHQGSTHMPGAVTFLNLCCSLHLEGTGGPLAMEHGFPDRHAFVPPGWVTCWHWVLPWAEQSRIKQVKPGPAPYTHFQLFSLPKICLVPAQLNEPIVISQSRTASQAFFLAIKEPASPAVRCLFDLA